MNEKTMRYLHYNLDKIEMNNKDKAMIPKGFEVAVREFVANGKIRANDFKPRTMGKNDCAFFITTDEGKKLVRLEVKCGCGALCYFISDGMGGYLDLLESPEEVTDEMILPRADYVIFSLESDIQYLKKPETVLQAYVLPRQRYVEMVHAMNHTGKLHIKIDKARGQVTLQTLVSYNKARGVWNDKPLQRGYDFLDNCPDTETLENFLTRYGRM